MPSEALDEARTEGRPTGRYELRTSVRLGRGHADLHHDLPHRRDHQPDPARPELEQRGFAGLYLPEHTHIPVERTTPYPAGGELPPEYGRTLDPFVALG